MYLTLIGLLLKAKLFVIAYTFVFFKLIW